MSLNDRRKRVDDMSDLQFTKKRSKGFQTIDDDDSDDETLEDIVFGGTTAKVKENEDKPEVMFFIDKGSGRSSEVVAWVDDDDNDGTEGTFDQPIWSRGMGNMRYQRMCTGDRKVEFEKVVGEAPAWAKSASKDDADESDHLLRSNFNYFTKSEHLAKGVLEFQKCTDANKGQISQRMTACEFHKGAQISLAAGEDCRLNLFQVDGKLNTKLHSFFTERFPIYCAHFLESGKEVIMTSNMRYFYSYDLISGKIVKFPHIKGTEDERLQKFYVSPDGKYLVFKSMHGHMHLISTQTKELIKTVKINGMVNDVAFRKNGQQFISFGEEGVVSIFDIRNKSCVHAFTDEGCNRGDALAVSPNNQYFACGSRSGIVNLYDESCMSKDYPEPVKSFKNLCHSIYSLQFNSTSEMLGMSSAECDNAVRLVHVPSMTVFSNFPGMENSHIKQVFKMDFSPHSGYLMLGNNKGKALLFRMQHYKSY